MARSTDAPLSGRRIYFVGIGGAGLSAYANFSRAWGAEVRGWEARDTIFLEALNGIEVGNAVLYQIVRVSKRIARYGVGNRCNARQHARELVDGIAFSGPDFFRLVDRL